MERQTNETVDGAAASQYAEAADANIYELYMECNNSGPMFDLGLRAYDVEEAAERYARNPL